MNMRRRYQYPALLLLSSVLGLSIAAAPSRQADEVEGFTEPYKQLELAFRSQGVVEEVTVKEGDLVKADQVIARQDDRLEQKELETNKLEAESTARVDYAEAEEKVKKIQLDRKEELLKQDAASLSEVEEAQSAYNAATASLKVAKLEHDSAKLKYEQQKVVVDLMQLRSPINGVVQKINIGQGEFVDPQRPEGSIVVVQNDPLKVRVHLPTAQAAQLAVGDTLQVRYPDSVEWAQAKIVFIDPLADAASGRQLLRLELPNPSGKAAGFKLYLKLPAELLGQAPVAGARQ